MNLYKACFSQREFVHANREKSMIGWRQTLSTSAPNHIRFSLVSGKKIAKWKTGFNLMAKVDLAQQYSSFLKEILSSGCSPMEESVFLINSCVFSSDGHVIQLMNENLNNGLSEEMIFRIFTDACEAVATLHHSQPPVMHRDLKVIIPLTSEIVWH